MINEEQAVNEGLKFIAIQMMIAARTAPKTRGQNHLSIAIAEKHDIEKISQKMLEIGQREQNEIFIRDAGNILQASYMLIVGAKIKAMGLQYCGLCGFSDCKAKEAFPQTPCVFNITDLGIAVSSAANTAAQLKADNRILYSAGMAVKEMNMLGEKIAAAFCIPITATSKNPFFDRK